MQFTLNLRRQWTILFIKYFPKFIYIYLRNGWEARHGGDCHWQPPSSKQDHRPPATTVTNVPDRVWVVIADEFPDTASPICHMISSKFKAERRCWQSLMLIADLATLVAQVERHPFKPKSSNILITCGSSSIRISTFSPSVMQAKCSLFHGTMSPGHSTCLEPIAFSL